MTTEKKRKIIINYIYYALIAGIVYVSLRFLLPWFLPFIIGFAVAVMIQKPVNYLHRISKIPRKIIAIVLVFLILGVLGILIWQALYNAAIEVGGIANYLATFVEDMPQVMDNLSNKWDGLFSRFSDTPFGIDPAAVLERTESLLLNLAKGLTTWTINTAKGIPNFLITFLITIIACCFISMDYDKIADFIKKQLSPKALNIVTKAKRLFFANIVKMIRAYALIMFITFIELSIGLSILKIDYAIGVAALISLVDILPVLGTGSVLIPWAVITLILGNTHLGIGIAIIYVVITVLRNILEPKIVGSQVGLHPVVTLMAMYVGLKLFGFLGLFLFPMTMIILKALHESGEIKIWK